MASRALARDDRWPLPNREEIAMTAPFVVNLHMPIDAEDREVAAELQSMLVELIDLALIGKQVHWNVEGPHFRSLHLELDELVDAWRALGDDVAERAGTLGAAPDGQAATVASQSDHAASGRPPQGLRRGQGGCRPGNRGRGTRASAHRSRSRPRPGFGGPPHRGAAHTREAALDPAGAACALLRRHPPGGALSDGSEAAERRPGPLRARPGRRWEGVSTGALARIVRDRGGCCTGEGPRSA